MKIYAVNHITGPLNEHPRISPVHSVLFDGEATRGGERLTHAPVVAYWTDDRIPLECTRHGRYVPPIFKPPGASWVVSEEVKNILEPCGPCEFLQVKFAKLVDTPVYEKGDFSSYSPDDYLKMGVDLTALLSDPPDVPGLHETIGNYYELLLPVHNIFKDDFQCTIPLHFSFNEYESVDITVSKELLEAYPMFEADATLFREEIFQLIEPCLDKDFFLIDSAEM